MQWKGKEKRYVRGGFTVEAAQAALVACCWLPTADCRREQHTGAGHLLLLLAAAATAATAVKATSALMQRSQQVTSTCYSNNNNLADDSDDDATTVIDFGLELCQPRSSVCLANKSAIQLDCLVCSLGLLACTFNASRGSHLGCPEARVWRHTRGPRRVSCELCSTWRSLRLAGRRRWATSYATGKFRPGTNKGGLLGSRPPASGAAWTGRGWAVRMDGQLRNAGRFIGRNNSLEAASACESLGHNGSSHLEWARPQVAVAVVEGRQKSGPEQPKARTYKVSCSSSSSLRAPKPTTTTRMQMRLSSQLARRRRRRCRPRRLSFDVT